MPLVDGGAKITNYIIEKRESTRKAFATVITNCPTTSVRIGDLGEGCEYYFRVSAENEYGIGEAVETTDPIRASQSPCAPENLQFKTTGLVPGHEYEFRITAENAAGVSAPSVSSPFYKATDALYKPGPPCNPRVLDTTKSSITVAWNKPSYDGGSDISGYIVETCMPCEKEEEEEWTIETEATINGLNAGEEYMFRVAARNEKGTSDPRQIGVPVIVKDLVIAPVAKMLFNTFTVLCGEDLTVEIPFFARPKAAISWVKDGQPLKRTTRVNFDATEAMLKLNIKEATKDDVGQYLITLSNSAGETAANVGIVVLDKPGQPGGPVKVDEVTSDSVTISWNPPEYSGGCTIKNYIVEKRDTSTTNWMTANFTNVIETEYVATGLVMDNQYEFRVIARNAAGVLSAPSDTTGPITARDEVEPPRISIDPEYTQTLVVNAGENFKIHADVHGKPLPSIHWMKGELELGNTIYRDIKNTPTKAIISVKEAKLPDGGQYTLLLKNPGGEKVVHVNVVVLDKIYFYNRGGNKFKNLGWKY
uniref:Titin n=1 Tax=Oryzias latipes TaxID=8090 RepID=A0A3P9JVU9_ORYLA